QGPGGAGEDLRLELDGGAHPGEGRPGVADGRLPRPLPDRLRLHPAPHHRVTRPGAAPAPRPGRHPAATRPRPGRYPVAISPRPGRDLGRHPVPDPGRRARPSYGTPCSTRVPVASVPRYAKKLTKEP